MPKISEINFKSHPYRGIMKEIADERGVTPQCIGIRFRNRSPEIVELVSTKARERSRGLRKNLNDEV